MRPQATWSLSTAGTHARRSRCVVCDTAGHHELRAKLTTTHGRWLTRAPVCISCAKTCTSCNETAEIVVNAVPINYHGPRSYSHRSRCLVCDEMNYHHTYVKLVTDHNRNIGFGDRMSIKGPLCDVCNIGATAEKVTLSLTIEEVQQ